MSERIPPDDLIAVAAFRYALGRMTYMVDAVANWLIANSEKLHPETRRLIASEISDAENQNELGMEMDAAVWRQVRSAMAEHS